MLFKIIKWIFTVAAIICYIAIFAIVCVVAPVVAGWNPIYVKSGSMEPSISTGNLVYYHKVENLNKLVLGDVIAFKTSTEAPLTTHRLVEIDEKNQTIRTKGDANRDMDYDVLQIQNVLGKVGSFQLPKMGFVIVYAQDPLVIASVAIIIVAHIVLSYIDKKFELTKKGKTKHEGF